MAECRVKLAPGWQQLCGKVATHIEAIDISGDVYGVVTCTDHANPAAVATDGRTDDELRRLCEQAGVAPGF